MPRAIAKLAELMESENESVALTAARAVLDYQVAKPKETPTVNVNLQSNPAAHLAALAQKVVQNSGGQSVNVLISQGNPELSSKQHVNHAPTIEGEAVRVSADSGRKPGG